MDAIEIARRLAELGQQEDAARAYALALRGSEDPAERMEAAVFLLQAGADYRVPYTAFLELHGQGHFQEDILQIVTAAFYEPNVRDLRARYERNVKRLKKYPYLFRKDFPPFEELPVLFFPYDDGGYVPFYRSEQRFGAYVDPRDPVVTRNFFKDLEKPILASDVFSQYELEYLNDNVRPSEWVGRENHVYLHYTDWGEFCSWLQVLSMRPLLEDKKLVFLIGDELGQYPIDFKKRFGVDYSKFPVKPVGVREVNRLIWHTQLSAHNGGDFFNEVLDGHPNLLSSTSVMLYSAREMIAEFRKTVEKARAAGIKNIQGANPRLTAVLRELISLPEVTDKDLMVAAYLTDERWTTGVDWASRVVPAMFFQPHFHHIDYAAEPDGAGNAVLSAEALDEIHDFPPIRDFRYIKTFTPLRRPTTSYGASVRFAYLTAKEGRIREDGTESNVVADVLSEQVLNRSFLIDPSDRLFRDSALVRFEDAKLNPRAAFTALAAFLDLPYTESMTRCTERGEDAAHPGMVTGFDPASVYKTYDDFANDSERYYLEYTLRDAYARYGYAFKYYDGEPMDEARLEELAGRFTTIDGIMRETWGKYLQKDTALTVDGAPLSALPEDEAESIRARALEDFLENCAEKRLEIGKFLLTDPRFVNRDGQPLRFMTPLELDPALLEQELYR